MNKNRAQLAMRKIITVKQSLISFCGIISVQLIDLDVAGKAFQILSCLNIALIDLDSFDSCYESLICFSKIPIDAAEIHQHS